MFLQGATTWLNIDTDIAKLLCGEINDGVGGNAGADAWLRDIDTAHNTLRSPASLDLTLSGMANRSGYWALMSSQFGSGPGQNPYQTSCKQVNPISTGSPGTGAASHGRVLIYLWCTGVNSVNGDYSTSRWSYIAYDADTFNSGSNLLTGANIAPTSGGVMFLYSGMSVQIANPSGFVESNSPTYVRGFTSTYTYGIDEWPFYANRTGAVSWTTAPSGTAGTDYDLVDQACTFGFQNQGNNIANGFTAAPFGAHFSGLGIKTTTGNSGARYVISSITVASQKFAIIKSQFSGGPFGVLDLIMGPAPADSINPSSYGGGIRPSHAFTIPQWLQMATTSGSVTNAMGIQYWISVKPTGVFIVLNADPGFTGKMGMAGLQQLENIADPTYDLRPWITNNVSLDDTSDQSNQRNDQFYINRSYWGMRRCQDGSTGARDWQTGWMRTDMATNGTSGTLDYLWNGCGARAIGLNMDAGASNAAAIYNSIAARTHPGSDNAWTMWGFQVIEATVNEGGRTTNIQGSFRDTQFGWNTNGTSAAYQGEKENMLRGQMATRCLLLNDSGWGSGDEITDSSSGAKYFLVKPDYPTWPGRVRNGVNSWEGGNAIKEV